MTQSYLVTDDNKHLLSSVSYEQIKHLVDMIKVLTTDHGQSTRKLTVIIQVWFILVVDDYFNVINEGDIASDMLETRTVHTIVIPCSFLHFPSDLHHHHRRHHLPVDTKLLLYRPSDNLHLGMLNLINS